MGLSREQAHRLAVGTFVGASELAAASDDPPEVLRQRVTSKGGTTYAAILSMEQDDLKNAFMRALHAARHRAAELGDALPVAWRHRSERYAEKLATPDTSVADLIGDVDPMKGSATNSAADLSATPLAAACAALPLRGAGLAWGGPAPRPMRRLKSVRRTGPTARCR